MKGGSPVGKATGIFPAVLAGLVAGACAPVGLDPRHPSELAGTNWTVIELDGQHAPLGPNPAATIRFGNDGSINGTSACNVVSGSAGWAKGGRFTGLATNPFVMTQAGCGAQQAGMAFGDRFWNGMQQARAWKRDDVRLTIYFVGESRAHLVPRR